MPLGFNSLYNKGSLLYLRGLRREMEVPHAAIKYAAIKYKDIDRLRDEHVRQERPKACLQRAFSRRIITAPNGHSYIEVFFAA